jgi:DNA-binding transcriptional LysR family regulator
VAHPYREEDVVAIAAPTHPLARKRSVSLELLAREPVVISEKGNVLRDLVEQKFSEKGLCLKPALEINVQIGGRDAIKRVVAQGLAIGFISKCHILLEVKAGQLKVLKVPELTLKRAMYITIHKNQENSFLVQEMRNFLRHYKP